MGHQRAQQGAPSGSRLSDGSGGPGPGRRAAGGVPGSLRDPDRALRALTPGWGQDVGRCAPTACCARSPRPHHRRARCAVLRRACPVPGQTLRAAPPPAASGQTDSHRCAYESAARRPGPGPPLHMG
uniref:Uncharacterized protein n=1 Tax=Streptomyces lividans 1326 TaxID=1200984 RepID=Q848F6_STRLI|nr:hypothetical protein [Streptomyces lividans 1326]